MKAVDIVGYDGFNASNDLLGLRNGARHELVADMAWQLAGIIVYLTITPAMGFQKQLWVERGSCIWGSLPSR